MTAAPRFDLVSVTDYLAGELRSTIKHEYLGGVVHAMAGARNLHNRIAVNVLARLHAKLRGQPCQPYNSDTKIRIQLTTQVRFYYPDVSVVCRPNANDDSYQDEPVVIFEVLSKKTRRIDEGEKRDAYLTLESLQVYVLIEQEFPATIIYRRGPAGFEREIYQGLSAVLPLSEIGIELSLAEVYESLELSPEPRDLLE